MDSRRCQRVYQNLGESKQNISTSKFLKMIQAGIIGGAGYTAGELIRLLIKPF